MNLQYPRQYKSFYSWESQALVVFSLSSSKRKQFSEFGFKIDVNTLLERGFPTLWTNNWETYSWTCMFVGLSFSLLVTQELFWEGGFKGENYGFNTESFSIKALSKEEFLGDIKDKSVRALLLGSVSLHFKCLLTGYFHLLIQKIC